METEISAVVRTGTHVGVKLRYKAWVDGRLVLDSTLDLQKDHELKQAMLSYWRKGGSSFMQQSGSAPK